MPNQSLQEIVCVLGQPVAGQPLQFMYERAFEKTGLDWRYLTLEVAPESLADALRGVRAMGFRGCHLSAPHLTTATAHLDALSEQAGLIGSASFVTREGESLVGENAHGLAFRRSLDAEFDPSGQRVVVLGAGSVARAIALELAQAGASEIEVVDRSAERGTSLAQLLRDHSPTTASYTPWQGDWQVTPATALLVQATSLGQNDPEAHVPVDWHQVADGELLVADVTFNPADTLFLAEAQQHGLRTVDALGMFVHHALISFERWTGCEADETAMREAVDEFFS